MSIAKFYLVAYNAAQFIGWSLVLYQTLHELVVNRSPAEVYAAAGLTTRKCIRTAQLLAQHVILLHAQLLLHSAHGLPWRMQASAKAQRCWRQCTLPLVRAHGIRLLATHLSACTQSPDALCSGLVRGSAPLSFLQWFGRSNVLFLVLHSIPEVNTSLKDAPARICLHNAAPQTFCCSMNVLVPDAALESLGCAGAVHCLGAC